MDTTILLGISSSLYASHRKKRFAVHGLRDVMAAR
jgi:hypothetical protein